MIHDDTNTEPIKRVCANWLDWQWCCRFYYRGLRLTSCYPSDHDTYTLWMLAEDGKPVKIEGVDQWDYVAVVSADETN